MMATQHYFSNAVGSVLFVPDSFVYLHWSGEPMSSPELRALYIHARNLLLRHELSGILADHRAMPTAFTEADREWLLGEWLPQTIAQTNTARYAALPSPDPARRLHTEPVIQVLRRYIKVELFDEINEAADWLSLAQQAQQSEA